MYSMYTASNIETLNVMHEQGTPWCYVHKDHPIIALLRNNSDLLGCYISKAPLHMDVYYKVSKQVLAVSAHTLRSRCMARGVWSG